MNQELSDFAARLRETILSEGRVTRGPDSTGRISGSYNSSLRDFNSLALELFALQFQFNPPYQTLCRARGVTPQIVEHWTQIPAVPTTAFKELELTSLAPDERIAVFHSSGTTEQKPSRHFHNAGSLALYEISLWNWFERCILRSSDGSSASSTETRGRAARAPISMICLAPPPAQVPHSSLVHMFETIRRKFRAPESVFVGKLTEDGTWTLDFDAVLATLNSAIGNRQSAILLGAAFSFVHLLDFLAENNLKVQLPKDSRVMETGGYKNRSRSMPKSELHSLITERLGVPPENILCEYGMSELSSQAYSATSDKWHVTSGAALTYHTSPITHHFHFPPWARAQIISPETGREVDDGEAGLIRVCDLANVFSVVAVQTEDLGVRRGNGFELIGRAQLAEPRGCSLMTA